MGLRRVFSLLAIGGHFLHQSFTKVGTQLDNEPIYYIIYYGYIIQSMNLPTSSNVIHYLQENPREI